MSTQHNDEETNEVEPAIDAAFLTLLQQHRMGHALNELSKAMREAIETSTRLDKPAGVTLKLAFKPAGNRSGAIVVVDDIKVTLPKEKPQSSMFFCDEAGNLFKNDPNQRELPLKAIIAPPVDVTQLRKVGAA